MADIGNVLGNGPSGAIGKSVNREEGAWYGCNMAGAEANCDVVFCIDPWGQFDIIRSGYRGECQFAGYDLIPIEMWVEDLIPAGYDYVVHNMEQKAESSNWYFYSTGMTDVVEQFGDNDYWAQNRSYVCYVPDYMRITPLQSMGVGVPTGAYALQYAVQRHKQVHVYGFDSLVGNFSGSWDLRNEPHKPGHSYDKWADIYSNIVANSDCEVIWHKQQ